MWTPQEAMVCKIPVSCILFFKERKRQCVCVCGWGVCVVQNQIIDQKRRRKLKKTSLDNGTRTQAYPGCAYEWSFMIKISLVEWKVITKYNSVLKNLCHIINVWCIFWKNDAFFKFRAHTHTYTYCIPIYWHIINI